MGIMQQFADGISVAGILLIVAIGLGITFGVMKIINMAHGELIMIGAYTTYMICTVGHMPFVVGMIVSFIVTALVGLLLEKFVLRRLYGRPMETLLATFGISIFLQQLIRMIFGPDGKSVTSPFQGVMNVGDVALPYYRLFIAGIALLMVLATAFAMFRTKFGIQLRSVSQNRDMCECLGINTSRIDAYTFAFGAGLAGLAGAILSPIKSVSPTMGLDYMIDSFMVVVLGGVGSLMGAVFGSAAMGESNQLLTTFMGETGAKIVVFLLIILVIRFKPEGLFRMERR
ncbi:urea ABC transporter permease subunit UrtB [Paenibacillus validus]|uniref:Urea ABC transporter permease subunit UrtB n=1 Tax=Paenibacillus validus TaxID=44253 RepID=A0A7X3CT22_9BACL|nr:MULTISPECIES: urea ABC transporter permease subunit UrtB [Paenibacillus]MED4601297.1 urea ABC transporter permease subunit UrtB [Paenibacillus validus]MED4605960.1 urea ABC transporter permease subunit UrtB [Paenibacillus validus]MUG71306.1 urea ABC transporter permease subunit UrtB [Paenibacillus validus]